MYAKSMHTMPRNTDFALKPLNVTEALSPKWVGKQQLYYLRVTFDIRA